jgi:hypothetical protein
VSDRILFQLSEESLPVPVEQAGRLVLKLRPVPGALSARAKVDRALSTRAAAVAFDRFEKTALLDALDEWLDESGFEALGPDLVDLRGALEYDLGVE